MITISGTVSGIGYIAELPNAADFGIVAPRPSSSRQTLAGSVIHQVANKNISAGTATYSNLVPAAQCAVLTILDNSGSDLFLSDGSNVYKVIIDASIVKSEHPTKHQVDIDINVVSKLF